eukprot:TRINITY_DN10653_c0_g1_i1.p1 TRINITY_DN10653_c0_g1~~TRINITY_DN10653_c0_g1_i1.p1  ORF type:complete len:752 (+),score=83.56 TRINITY_DN10653_c0_g1_i1:122-2257(+)
MPFQLPQGSTASDCQSACQLTADCVAWAYGNTDKGCDAPHSCWLKEQLPSLTQNSCRTSGYRDPTLKSVVFKSIPVGQITPRGWLLTQLELQATGLAGHLQDFYPNVANSTWIGGDVQDPNDIDERLPYWLNGIVPLVYQLAATPATDKTVITPEEEETLVHQVEGILKYIMVRQNVTSGWLGGNYTGSDPWPRWLVVYALFQYHEATGDELAVEASLNFLRGLRPNIEQTPLSSWDWARYQDLINIIHYAYENYDQDYPQWWLDFAETVNYQGLNWTAFYNSSQFPTEPCTGTCPSLYTHGVNNGMALKSCAVWSRQTTWTELEINNFLFRENLLDTYHGAATGMFTCSEHLAGRDPSQGYELCTIVEVLYSLERTLEIFGYNNQTAEFADRVEHIAYNALPGAIDPTMWSHVYLSQTNNIASQVCNPPIYVTDGPDSNIYGLAPNYGCCTVNFGQGWPKFLARMYTVNVADGGIVALYYGPSQLRTTLKNTDGSIGDVSILQTTDYPFNDTIEFVINTTSAFNLHFRVPGWAQGASIETPTEVLSPAVSTLAMITVPKGESFKVTLKFPMEWRAINRPSGALNLWRGPILYGLRIDQNWTQLAYYAYNSSDWQIEPSSNWTYAIKIDPNNPGDSIQFTQGEIGQYPYAPWAPPLSATIQGRLIKWGTNDSAALVPPPSPVFSTAPLQELTLYPFGATQLRIAELPYLLD